MERDDGQVQATREMEKGHSTVAGMERETRSFNSKVPKPNAEAPVEIIQEDDSIPHIDLKGQKKTEQEEIVVDKELQEMKFESYDRENEKKIAEVVKKAKADDGFRPRRTCIRHGSSCKEEQYEELDKIIEQHEEPQYQNR